MVVEVSAASLVGCRVLLVVVQFCHPRGARGRGGGDRGEGRGGRGEGDVEGR